MGVRIRFVSDFVLGKILGSMNIMEDLLQSKFVSCAILGTLQKYYRRVEGDTFLQLRGLMQGMLLECPQMGFRQSFEQCLTCWKKI